ncbi:MAG: hypothetical protein FWC32_03895 [Firmicutes bacterium]|nr:hypothetical protein [Bacillota bacterium]
MKARWLTVIFFTLFISLIFAACGNRTKPETIENSPASTCGTVISEPWDPFGRFCETVYVTQTRILAAWMGFDEGDCENDNWWTRTYYEQLNVRLTNLFTAPMWGPDFDMLMNLAFATGNLPDVMPLYTSLAVRAIEGNLVMDITDIFERYTSGQVKEIFATDPAALEAWSVDGRLMGLTAPVGGDPDWPFFWIPKSMLDDFNGGVIPSALAEINRLARWIKEQTGAYAIGLDNRLYQLNHLLPMFGATNEWIVRDGEMVWGRIQPEMRDVWVQLAEWYREGLLAADFSARSDEDIVTDFAHRRFGLLPGGKHTPNGPAGRTFISQNPYDDLAAIPLMRADGQPLTTVTGAGYNNVLMISAGTQNPQAIMRMFNLGTAISNDVNRPGFVTDYQFNTSPGGNMNFWNRMGTGTGYVTDTRTQYNPAIAALNAFLSGSDGSDLVNARAFGVLENFQRITNWINYGTSANAWEGNWAMWSMLLGAESQVYAFRMRDEGRITATPRWGMETSAEAELGAKLHDRFIEFATTAIINDDADRQFNNWVQFFYNNGGHRINAEVAEWWAANK